MAMKKQAEEMQAQLANEFFVGNSRNGQVSLTINGNQEITAVTVAEGMQSNQIEKSIIEAHVDARKKSESVLKSKLMGMM